MAQNDKYQIGWQRFLKLCDNLSYQIRKEGKEYQGIFCIPKNGLFVAERLSKELDLPIIYDFETVKTFCKEDILIVDDLIDSGRTLLDYPKFDKAVIFVKNNNEDRVNYYSEKTDKWVVFPWEKEKDIEEIIIRQLEYIGENPTREGLLETPKRVVKSWQELYGGYSQYPEDIMKSFKDGACDEMVILKDIEFYSTCEHHMLPFFGKIHVGYIPDKKVIGVSKIARLIEIFSRRLQIQEKLVNEIALNLSQYLEPMGVMVVAEAQHFCMTSRGVKKQQSKMITSSVQGVFKEDIKAREEFLNLIRS